MRCLRYARGDIVTDGTSLCRYINVTSSGNKEPSSDLRNRLRKSLLAKFASKQETDALDFANSAKELLSNTSSIVSSSASVPSDRHIIQKDEHTSAKMLFSKTIEILESSTNNSQNSLRSMATNVSEVDVAPTRSSKVMDSSSTVSATASASSVSGSKWGVSSNSRSAASERKSLYGLDDVSTEGCNVLTGGAEVSCDSAAPSSKTGMDESSSADSPEQIAPPDHCWDPEELKVATGSADSTVAKHELKLFSVYPEISVSDSTLLSEEARVG